jgi:hypothetical protein
MLLTDRLERVAKAESIAEREWRAPTGTELRLIGLDEGPILQAETSPGGGLTIRADKAAIKGNENTRRLVWMAESNTEGDGKAQVQVRLRGSDGSVTLIRSGQPTAPQLRIRSNKGELFVETGVTLGNSMRAPNRTILFGKHEVVPEGMGFSFKVPTGGAVAIELPAPPGDRPSDVVVSLGAIREEEEDTVLPLREVAIAHEGVAQPKEAACATANHRYAWRTFLRPTLFPVPSGADCERGYMTGRNFSIDARGIAVSLEGSAWQMKDGKPVTSLWSWANTNPVLSIVIKQVLPWAVSLSLGFLTWRRRTGAETASTPQKPATGKPTLVGRRQKNRPRKHAGN